MFDLTVDLEPVRKEIRAKTAAMRDLILGFVDDASPRVNEVAKDTIFSGHAESSLKVQSGETQKLGLTLRRVKRFSGKLNYAGEAYWSKATNLFDNFKQRKRYKLLKSLKGEFEKNSAVQSTFDRALARLERTE